MLGNQERDYRDTMDLQKVLSGIGAQKAQLSLEESIRDLPLSEAKRQRDIQDADLTRQYAPELKEILVKDKRRTDTKEEALLPSSIELGLSENKRKISDNKMKEYDQAMNHMISLKGILEQSDDPTTKAMFLEEAQRLGMDPNSQIFKHLSSASNPQTLRQRVDDLEKFFRTKKDENWITMQRAEIAQKERETAREQTNQLRLLTEQGRNDRNTSNIESRERIEQARNALRERLAKAQGEKTAKTFEAEAIKRLEAGDKEGHAYFVQQALLAKQAKDNTSIAFLLTQNELAQLPEKQRTPEKRSEIFQKHRKQLNDQENSALDRLLPSRGRLSSSSGTPLSGNFTNSEEVRNSIIEQATAMGIDPAVALAVAEMESGFNPEAQGPQLSGNRGNAFGAFQIIPSTGRSLEEKHGGNHRDPKDNIRLGLQLLKENLDSFGGNYRNAIAAHQAGAGAVRQAGGPTNTSDGLTTNQDYTNRVESLADKWRQILGNRQFTENSSGATPKTSGISGDLGSRFDAYMKAKGNR
jgi:soluble lytic murein transglycosylase-like protein